MLKTILGVLVMLIPFLLLYRFKDKKIGFFTILSLLIGFNFLLGVGLQTFGMFKYWIVMFVLIVADLFVLGSLDYKKLGKGIKEFKIGEIDWVFVFVFVVLFICLFSVHYNYTGQVTTAVTSYNSVSDLEYKYPYFSDEWVGVAMMKYSLESGKLPLVNPLWFDNFFPNFEFAFHSFGAQIMMVLNLNPLTQYTLLSLFSGLLICSLVYFILRANKINRLVSAVIALSVPYIVNGANLPGIWVFIPLIMGLICLLLGVFFISVNKKKMALLLGLLSLIFYPPLFVFYSVALIFYFIFANMKKKEKIKYLVGYFVVILIAGVFVGIFVYLKMDLSLYDFVFQFIKNKMIYPTITTNAIPNFSIYRIIPIPIILLAIFGAIKIFKKKLWLVASVLVGLIYWWFYSFMLWRFIIEYERVVFTTSVLITILAGFGLHYLILYLKEIEFIKRYNLVKLGLIVVLAFFLFSAFSYTERDNWKKLKLYSILSDSRYSPASPANMYFQEDDLRLFENITEKKFLSIPWKGLVIGTATDNYPLHSKDSTITNGFVKYSEFSKADCEKKTQIARDYGIQYVYLYEFNCTGFDEIGRSGEGLVLYETGM